MTIPSVFLSTPLLIVYGVIAILFCIQLYYYLSYYTRIAKAQKKQKGETLVELPPLSVIICVQNQLDEVRANIERILKQDYPKFEVIVIDLASEDDTKFYLEQLGNSYNNFYFSYIPPSARFISRRKLAQTIAVKASKYDWLVFTEINSQPVSDQWLRKLMEQRQEDTEIILGYNRYKRENTWINRLSSYDNQLLNMRYLGSALGGSPYMGVGRNLAYKKELFHQTKAFNNQLNLQRGEDDLFINQFANSKNTKVAVSPEAIIEVNPIQTRKEWRILKRSYLLSLNRFKGGSQYCMGFETTTRFLFYISSIALIVFGIAMGGWVFSLAALFLFILRWVVQAFVINKIAKKMGEQRRYRFSLPLLDIIIPIKTFVLKFKLPRKSKGDIVALS